MSTRLMRAARGFAALPTPITDTGMRGFLKWAQREYPSAIYQQLANYVQQQFPQAFSGYMLGGWRGIAKLNGFADTTGTATVDTSDAANSTASSPSWSDEISQVIGTLTGAYLNVQQQQAQQQVLQAQLQQAANGGKPLNVSLPSLGINFGSSTDPLTLLFWGGLAFVALKATKVLK